MGAAASSPGSASAAGVPLVSELLPQLLSGPSFKSGRGLSDPTHPPGRSGGPRHPERLPSNSGALVVFPVDRVGAGKGGKVQRSLSEESGRGCERLVDRCARLAGAAKAEVGGPLDLGEVPPAEEVQPPRRVVGMMLGKEQRGLLKACQGGALLADGRVARGLDGRKPRPYPRRRGPSGLYGGQGGGYGAPGVLPIEVEDGVVTVRVGKQGTIPCRPG